jgi:hypothetical protein
MKNISITQGKGFHMTFANGWTVSVQFGAGNYSDNYAAPFPYDSQFQNNCGALGSDTAEIAAFRKDTEVWHDFGGDTVKGYCTPNEVAEFIAMVANKKD